MALTKDQIDTINNQTNTKKEFEEALHEYADEHPALLEVTTDLKRAEMQKKAKEVLDGEITSEAKVEAIKRMNETSDAVVALRRQPFLRLHKDSAEPFAEQSGEMFTLRMFGKMGTKHLDRRRREPQYEEYAPPENRINTTPLSEVPEWAYERIYDLALDGTIKIFDNEDQAQAASRAVTHDQKPILADPTKSPEMIKEMQEGRNGRDATLVSIKPGLRNASAEQDAAWHVLNSEINGIPPIPKDPEDRSEDYNDLTETELQLVTDRIKKGLEKPQQFTNKMRRGDDFKPATYLSQLLKLELSGKTAPRTGNDRNISNVTRREVVKIIRGVAQDLGYTVTGSFVREDPSRAVGAQLQTDPSWKSPKQQTDIGEAMPHRG